MSGSSADGVDVALVRIVGSGTAMQATVVAHHQRPYETLLRRAIQELRGGAVITLPNLAWAARDISTCYALAINELLLRAGQKAANVAAVAAHGQTLYHDPPDTLQWLDPSLIAAETGCPVVSDFRRADCAAGGQGAPLVPFADYCLFRHPTRHRILLNIGGIANFTYLPASAELAELIAFDTGPGNCICDYLMRTHEPSGPGWDEAGQSASQGVPIAPLLNIVMGHPYFAQSPPKSTDGPAMIRIFMDALADLDQRYPLASLLKTSCVVTARSIAQAVRQFCVPAPDEIIVSGGGVQNRTLISLLAQELGGIPITNIEDLGFCAQAKEAVAFALLGAATLDNVPSNVPAATGARRPVVLGSITPRP
jgi:anhydro-N-acetylmuramic acid kinase